MNLHLLIFLVILSYVAAGRADERSVWLAERRSWLERAKTYKDFETIENLSRIVRGIGSKLSQATPEAKDLYYQAQEELLAIPGHAVYYEKSIKDLQFKLVNAPDVEKYKYRNDYWSLQSDAFSILANLPSPESVRVLGDFLADEIGGIDFSKVLGEHPTESQFHNALLKNCDLAVPALYKLIADPPVKEADRYNYKNIETWKLWYERVKAGNRTFRFKDDPTEYDLKGPAPQEKLARIERDRKRDEERTAGKKRGQPGRDAGASGSAEAKPFSIVAILAAVALGMAFAWYFLKGGKKA